jgi:hypothetical protein
MPYIGKTPLTGAYQLCDAITTSATATYNLLVGGSAVIPGAAQNCIVSLNGVVQAPVSAYTVSGSTIVFSNTLSATDVIDFILILGNVFDIGKPTDGSVTNASVASNAAIAFTKLASTGTITLDNIQFPATAVPSANANNLDDYEEGTWTPVATVSGFSTSISSLTGVYTKIGRSVTVAMSVALTTDGRPTSYSQFSGLPFSVVNLGIGFCANNSIGDALGGTGTATVASSTSIFWGTTGSNSNSGTWFTSLTYNV